MGNRSENRFGIAAAEDFHLPALHHFAQHFHIVRMMLKQKFQQPAAEMHGKAKLRIVVQRVNEGPVAARMGVVNDFREITHRLMGVDTEKKFNRGLHEFFVFRKPAAWRRMNRNARCLD